VISSAIADIFENHGLREGEEVDLFYGYEPWDPCERPDWLIEYAKQWDVELEKTPGLFQSGCLLSKKYLTLQQGGNQIGKSYPCLVRNTIEMTGELPICYRYAKDVDTGVKRAIYDKNVRRWGRRDKKTGEVIDYDDKAFNDGSWDCGNIIGQGLYPKELIPPRGSRTWICTFKQALEEMWWPDMKALVPDHLLDKSKGTDGFTQTPRRVYFNSGGFTSFLTYEQGYERTEAKMVWRVYLDEEPPDRKFYLGALQHAENMSMMFTPIRGISWSYKDIYLPAITGKDPNIVIHHATQFDCPWNDQEEIKKKLLLMKPYEVAARTFGKYSEQRGKPYFDRDKLNRWIKRWVPTGELVRFQARQTWGDPRELLTCYVDRQEVAMDEHSQEQDTWEMYEDAKEGTAYWVSADTSQGQTDGLESEDVLDRNVAYVWRLPDAALDGGDKEEPIMVAAIRSIMRTIPFSRVVLTACRYYNNALLAAETRGESGSTFLASSLEYPFWFKMAVVNQISRKTIEKLGFDTTKNHRQQAFDYIGDWIDNRVGTKSDLPHLPLLSELACCVVGRNGKPDHVSDGTLDCAIAMGIGLWVDRHARTQIRDNSSYSPKRKAGHKPRPGERPMIYIESKRRKMLGQRGNR